MTFDTHVNDKITAQIEELHDEYADTGEDVFIFPTYASGSLQIAIIEAPGVGTAAMDDEADLDLVDPHENVSGIHVERYESGVEESTFVLTADGELLHKHVDALHPNDNVDPLWKVSVPGHRNIEIECEKEDLPERLSEMLDEIEDEQADYENPLNLE